MVIWKFPFEVDGKIEIEMPKGARILTVQTQDNMPCIWAIVDPNAEKVKRRFEIHGTGYGTGCPKKYIGTFQMYPYVWHLFEEV